MAAILALVFVPALFAVLFMLGGFRGDMSFSMGLAATVFVGLAVGMLTGLFRLARSWDKETAKPHRTS